MARRKTTPFDPVVDPTAPVAETPTPKAPPRLPRTAVLDRRLLHPFGSPSVPITLTTEGPWEIRFVDSQLRAGRLHDIIHQKGWQFVEAHEIDGKPDEYGLRVLDGRLVRGENGREVLVKMPKAMYDAIAERKSEINLKGLGKKATRELAAQATAQAFGDEAGDRVHKSVRIGNEEIPVLDTTTSRGPSAELEGEEFV